MRGDIPPGVILPLLSYTKAGADPPAEILPKLCYIMHRSRDLMQLNHA